MPNEPTALEVVESLEGTERAEYLKTGELPAPKEEKPPTKEVVAVETEPTFQQPKTEKATKKPNQMGYSELRQTVAALEKEVAELRKPKEEPKPEPKAEEKKEPELRAKPTLTDKDKDGKPKYSTYEDYMEDLTDWKTEKKLSEFKAELSKQETEKAEKSKAADANQKISETWRTQVDAVRAKHEDYDAVALAPDLPIPPGSAVEQWILQLSREGSPVGAEMLYHFGGNREELKAINEMPPVAAARHLAALEAELTGEEPPPEPKAEEPANKQPKRISDAPPPVPEVGNRQAAGYDPAMSALKDGDFETYRKAMNAKERSARKG